MREDYRIGDPVMDAAQGRPMVVVATPEETVAEWSDANDYELTENYANAKFDPHPQEPAVECVYVSDVRSEPSKTYTFPASRLRLIDAHHADDGRRVADRVIVDVLEELFDLARVLDEEWSVDPEGFDDALGKLVANATGIDDDVAGEAIELADVTHTVGGAADDA